MLSPTGRIACSSDDGGCAGRGVAADRVSQDGQILAAELETKIVTEGEVRRVLWSSANIPRAAHPRIKAWLSRLRAERDTDKSIPEKMIRR